MNPLALRSTLMALLGFGLLALSATTLALEPDIILDSDTSGVVHLEKSSGAGTHWDPEYPTNAFRGSSQVLTVGSGSGYFEFHTTLPKEGPWQVFIWHSGSSNNSSTAIVTHGDNETTNVSYSQSSNLGQWLELGTFWFTTDEDGAKVKVNSVYNRLSADAVRFSYADPSVIVDSTANSSNVTLSTSGGSSQWTAVTALSGNGGNLHRSKTNGATATFKPTIPTPGNYDLSIWLPPSTGAWLPTGESAVTSFGVDITARSGTVSETVTIPTGHTNEGQWVQIGTGHYLLDATGGSTPNAGRVVVKVTGSTYWVPADAVRWTKAGGLGYVMDEDDGSPMVTSTGSWSAGTAQGAQTASTYKNLYHGAASKTAYFASGGNSSERVMSYKPAIQELGLYDIYVWYPSYLGSAANASTQLKIETALGQVTRTLNQQLEGGKWVHAGRYILDTENATPPPELRISTPPVPGNGNWTGLTGYVLADGVMFFRDLEEHDADDDGLPDWHEQVLSTNELDWDTDDDDIGDGDEYRLGLNPLSAIGTGDSSEVNFTVFAPQTTP